MSFFSRVLRLAYLVSIAFCHAVKTALLLQQFITSKLPEYGG